MSVNAKQKLVGDISTKQNLVGTVGTRLSLSGKVNVGSTIKAENYEGEYEVIPSREAQILETGQKFMAEDVMVHKIPFHEVSNLNGGTTITIGKDVLNNG